MPNKPPIHVAIVHGFCANQCYDVSYMSQSELWCINKSFVREVVGYVREVVGYVGCATRSSH